MKTLALSDALAAAEVSRHELAAAVGVDPSTVWRWMSSSRAYRGVEPSASQLDAIGRHLRLSPHQQAALAAWYAAGRAA